MPVCGYLVISDDGAADGLARQLAELPGCDVVRAENRDLLLLVTDTPGSEEDRELRERIQRLDGVRSLVLTFGEIQEEHDS